MVIKRVVPIWVEIYCRCRTGKIFNEKSSILAPIEHPLFENKTSDVNNSRGIGIQNFLIAVYQCITYAHHLHKLQIPRTLLYKYWWCRKYQLNYSLYDIRILMWQRNIRRLICWFDVPYFIFVVACVRSFVLLLPIFTRNDVLFTP